MKSIVKDLFFPDFMTSLEMSLFPLKQAVAMILVYGINKGCEYLFRFHYYSFF